MYLAMSHHINLCRLHKSIYLSIYLFIYLSIYNGSIYLNTNPSNITSDFTIEWIMRLTFLHSKCFRTFLWVSILPNKSNVHAMYLFANYDYGGWVMIVTCERTKEDCLITEYRWPQLREWQFNQTHHYIILPDMK